MSVAIPKKAQYNIKPSAPKGKRTRRVLPSLGNNPSQGYSLGTDTITFYVPGGVPNTVMDGSTGYFRYTVGLTTNSNATGAVSANQQQCIFDYTASSPISRVDIYGSGGQLIESVSRYNLLANVLYDVTHTHSDMMGLSSMIGSSNIISLTSSGLISSNRTGYIMTNSQATAGASTSTTDFYSFTIPILSSLFSLSESYLPTFALNDDIRIDVVLESQQFAFNTNTPANGSAPVVKILNPELSVDFIELEPSAMNAVKQSYAGGDIVVHSNSYHMYETTIPAGVSSTWNSILPCKAMSAKAYFGVFRNLAIQNNITNSYALALRMNPFYGQGSTFNLNIGGTRVPQRPITASKTGQIEEFAVELQKAMHSLWDPLYNGLITRDGFVSALSPAYGDNPTSRAFLVGLNLDMLRGNSDQILSGYDFSKVTTYIEGNIGQALLDLTTLSSFILHDILLVVDSMGNLTSKF